ncbi:MAG: hypothetical protein MI975_24670 [Cytophagales bacterium]|nr:hypothetical protein [Cytophagales bacterium]
MKFTLLKIISYLALAGTIIPSFMVFFGDLDIKTNKQIMAFAMLVWFATAPFWINKKRKDEAVE